LIHLAITQTEKLPATGADTKNLALVLEEEEGLLVHAGRLLVVDSEFHLLLIYHLPDLFLAFLQPCIAGLDIRENDSLYTACFIESLKNYIINRVKQTPAIILVKPESLQRRCQSLQYKPDVYTLGSSFYLL
jgi:hypothetical protein